MKNEHERLLKESENTLSTLHSRIDKIEKENRDLLNQLEEERRYV